MIPRSGGQYVFAQHALGDYAGFVVGWSDWISTCGSSSFISLVIAQYAIVLFPAAAGRATMIALAVVLLFGIIQWRGIRWGSGVQNVTSLVKALAFVALVVSCFVLGGNSTRVAVRAGANTSGVQPDCRADPGASRRDLYL